LEEFSAAVELLDVHILNSPYFVTQQNYPAALDTAVPFLLMPTSPFMSSGQGAISFPDLNLTCSIDDLFSLDWNLPVRHG